MKVDPGCRLPQLNVAIIPAGINDTTFRQYLLQRHGIEIGAGLGVWSGKVWRIGLMGIGATLGNVEILLDAFEDALASVG